MIAVLLLLTVPALPLVDSTPSLTSPSGEVPPEDAPACPDTAYVRDLGPACRRSSGLLAHFNDDGELLGLTHGPDPAPPEQVAGDGSHGPDSSLNGADERAPACVERGADAEFYGHVVYAVPSDWSPHSDSTEDKIRSTVRRANGLLHATAQDHDTTADYRMLCEGGELVVDRVVLPTSSEDASFSTIVQDLRELGYDEETAKYWVWYPDQDACWCGGYGHLRPAESLSPHNAHNGRAGEPMFGVTFGYFSTRTMMHENGHNLGAVQPGAPNFYDNYGGWHCSDEQDVMCYGPDTRSVCDWQRWDCGGDDYYNPDPAPGSYLAEHWNIGHPYNRFLDMCMEERAVVVAPGDAVHMDVPASCAGNPYGLVAHPVTLDLRMKAIQRGTLEMCWTQGSTTLGCDSTSYRYLWTHGRIPAGATGVTITMEEGAALDVLLRAS